MFTGIGCFDGLLSLQLKVNSKPYQAPPRHVVYGSQKSFKVEQEWLQQQDIITALGIDETIEWCNSFVFVQMLNGKVRLYLDPERLNEAVIQPVHRGPTLNDTFPKIINTKYLFLIDASSRCHNLWLNEQ